MAENVSFEEQMEKLEQVVEQLERGTLPLEQSVVAFQQGMLLIKDCKAKLDQVELTVRKVIDENGTTVPFETEEDA